VRIRIKRFPFPFFLADIWAFPANTEPKPRFLIVNPAIGCLNCLVPVLFLEFRWFYSEFFPVFPRLFVLIVQNCAFAKRLQRFQHIPMHGSQSRGRPQIIEHTSIIIGLNTSRNIRRSECFIVQFEGKLYFVGSALIVIAPNSEYLVYFCY